MGFYDDGDMWDDSLEVRKHARRDGPPESKEAAADVIRSGRAAKQIQQILARLRCGPATSADLAEIALRYAARLWDLREAGHVITSVRMPNGGGLWLYTLVEDEHGSNCSDPAGVPVGPRGSASAGRSRGGGDAGGRSLFAPGTGADQDAD